MFTNIVSWIVFVFVSISIPVWVYGFLKNHTLIEIGLYKVNTKKIFLSLVLWFLAGHHLFG